MSSSSRSKKTAAACDLHSEWKHAVGWLPGRLGHLKKFSPLQECDDWLSADPTKREFRPSKSDNDRLVAVLDFLPAVVALGDKHGRRELCGCVLNLYNASTIVS